MGAYLPLPYVYEREGRQERAWDIYSRLTYGTGSYSSVRPIDDYVANSIIAQLALPADGRPEEGCSPVHKFARGKRVRRHGHL